MIQIPNYDRITRTPGFKKNRPCIRDTGITVGKIVSLTELGHEDGEILQMYPLLDPEDIAQARAYARNHPGEGF